MVLLEVTCLCLWIPVSDKRFRWRLCKQMKSIKMWNKHILRLAGVTYWKLCSLWISYPWFILSKRFI